MMMPDLLGCPEHGTEDWVSWWSTRDQKRRWYCRTCRRLRSGRRHYDGPRCYKRGHLKTPWTWKFTGHRWRCLPCQYQRDAEREARRA